jgi:Fe-S-cluster containining protein
MARRPFYRDGIRFKCQGTGRCCTARGGYGYVYFTLEDRRRIARHLGMRTSDFTRRYCGSHDGHYHLKNPEQDCMFLDGKSCSIYKARPTQCRVWPFYPENLNARTWRREVESLCPGVGKGPLYTADQIRARAARMKEEQKG